MDQGVATKKRKMILQEEEEDDEDVKIEKFFALIRSTKDIRDRLLGSHALNLPPKPPPPPAAITAAPAKITADLEPSLEESDFGVMSNGGGVLKLADLNATAKHQDTGGGDGGGGDCSARLGEDSEIVMRKHQASNNNRSRIVMELDLNLSL